MALVGDMVLQTANAPGTGVFNFIAAPAGRSSFLSQCGAGQVYYFAEDAASWEKGIGTLVAGSPDTLSRDIVLGNSLGTNALINFPGQVTIICDIPAERSIYVDVANAFVDIKNRTLANLAPAFFPDQAPRLDQVANVRGNSLLPSNGVFIFVLPAVSPGNSAQALDFEFRRLTSAGDASYYIRLSLDGGQTYMAGAADYNFSVAQIENGTATEVSNGASYAPVTYALRGSAAAQGRLRFDPVSMQWDGSFVGISPAGRYARSFAQGNGTGQKPTHLVFGAVGVAITQGTARISQVPF